MKDFKIEYRDGKLRECRIDGVQVESLSSIHLVHELNRLPTVTFTTQVSSKETLIPTNPDLKAFESVQKFNIDVK